MKKYPREHESVGICSYRCFEGMNQRECSLSVKKNLCNDGFPHRFGMSPLVRSCYYCGAIKGGDEKC